MENKKIIGIVGGLGPFAGIDLVAKILDQTEASRDQEHLPIVHMSFPADIGDRTQYLLKKVSINPAYEISKIILKLEQVGASIAGISCNTAHSPQIFDVIIEELKKANSKIKLFNMIEEVVEHIKNNYSDIKNVGILTTTGLYETGAYKACMEKQGLNVIVPDEFMQKNIIHNSIYDPNYGIKAKANPVTEQARKTLLDAINYLISQNAQAIVLGCTEIGLAISETSIGNAIIIDSTKVLARALIKEAAPEKLKKVTYFDK